MAFKPIIPYDNGLVVMVVGVALLIIAWLVRRGYVGTGAMTPGMLVSLSANWPNRDKAARFLYSFPLVSRYDAASSRAGLLVPEHPEDKERYLTVSRFDVRGSCPVSLDEQLMPLDEALVESHLRPVFIGEWLNRK